MGGSSLKSPMVLQVVAVVLALAGIMAALFLPLMTQETLTSSPGAEPVRTIESLALLQTHPPTILIPLAVPLVLTLAPLLVPRRMAWPAGILCTVVLFGVIALAMASVGWFYLPALGAAIAAVILRRPARLTGNRSTD